MTAAASRLRLLALALVVAVLLAANQDGPSVRDQIAGAAIICLAGVIVAVTAGQP